MTTDALIQKAKKVAVNPYTALNREYITTSHAKSLNITVSGPVVIKGDGPRRVVIVPINVFSFHSRQSYNKRVVLNAADLTVICRL